ncbi:MAG: hypothetical protein KGZ85_05195 [Ignavibacterium sp.]|nr:hypothetical protein [Ignavibacterium sp.]
MKFRIFYLLLNIFCLFILSSVFAQQNYNTVTVTDSIPINFENQYYLSAVNIIPNTEIITLRGNILSKEDYNISYQTASFNLSESLPFSIFDTIYVSYQSMRLGLQKEYKRRSLVVKYDNQTGDSVRTLQPESGGFSPEAIFGPGIQKSGTIVRGFTVGTTKDFSLNSGLRLQLSGRLSDDIEIVAALTDENTPIQPEGNTERLEELDKVFIQVKHPNAIGTFGDYQLKKRFGEFGVIDRKLQGLMGEFFIADYSGYIAIASSRGKFNSNLFNGIDGVQGPYRLSGINNERDIIIIAGTEKVFIDGIEMRRGENNDYIIEYSNATITFTPNKLITSASRINVDFEYTDRRFTRSFFGAGTGGKFFKDKLDIKFQYLREGDDQDAPIDIALSDSDKEILSLAGDDRNKAVKSGVTLAEPDSLGNINGTYTKVDTLINGEPFSYYIFDPGESNSLYNVSFSFVGEGQGDYIRESLGNYRFTGIGLGGYLPVIYLPVPQLKQIGNVVVDINPIKNLFISLEYAGSLWDKNRFSNLDEQDNYGYARNISLRLNPTEVKIGTLNLGKAGFSFRDRFIQDKFTSADRFNEVEFNRNYNTLQSRESDDELLREIGLTLLPINNFKLSASAGFLRKGDSFSSDRFNNILSFSDNKTFGLNYNLDYVKSKNELLSSSWFRHRADAFYTYLIFKPAFEFIAEDKVDKRTNSDSLIVGSLKYFEYIPSLQLVDVDGFNFIARYSLRDEYIPVNGVMRNESIANTHSYEASYSGIREVNTSLNLTFRDKKYSDSFKEKGFLDSETILVRSQSRFKFWDRILNGDLFYEVSTQRSARLQKVFVRVEQGTGNFKYLGDLNNNGIADENEFEPTIFDGDFIQVTIPTDELFPVIDLKASTRWKINFSDLFSKTSLPGIFLNPLSSETFWRIEENSRETDYAKIYFLNFSSFLNEGQTIRGSNYFQQDIFVFENQQDLSFRFRFTERNSLNEFFDGYERGYNRERSLRIKFKLIKEVSNQTDIVSQTDNVSAGEKSNRRRSVTNNDISSDFSYRPVRNIEVGFKIKVGRSEDIFPENPTVIDLNSQLLRFNLSFLGTGRLRVELERNELIANTTQNFIPFELTGGNQIGKNYYWRLNFDYRLSANLQTTISYDGRILGASRAIHTARAEARAYF